MFAKQIVPCIKAPLNCKSTFKHHRFNIAVYPHQPKQCRLIEVRPPPASLPTYFAFLYYVHASSVLIAHADTTMQTA
eukprot:scaffold319497_cov12-Tisochrysis_lutea.AAC.1